MAELPCPNCGTHNNSSDALYCSECGHPIHQAASDPLIGQTIGGRYYLVERIGQGSAGTLYRAEHTTLRRRVAVKLLHKQLTASEDAIERFRREAITVCEIDNDHIPQVHDFGRTDDGRLFFAMEFLDGETLSQMLSREGRLSPERTADILAQIADGLMEAHTLGYVHRDLRPRSIFLTRRRGRQDFVKILDFGLAKLVQPEVDAQRTTMGMTYGDPRYMAPEQTRGETVDRRGDIYSLGAVGFELLAGEPPYKGSGHFEVLNQILDAPVPRLRDRRPDCPAWLESVVRTALAKKPAERFQTVAQLLDALERKQVLQNQPPMPMAVVAPAAGKLPGMAPMTTLKPQPLANVVKPQPAPAARPQPGQASAAPSQPLIDPSSGRTTAVLPTVAPGTPVQPQVAQGMADVPSPRQTLSYPAIKPLPLRSAVDAKPAASPPAPSSQAAALSRTGFGERPASTPLLAVKQVPIQPRPAVTPIIVSKAPPRNDPTPRTARAMLEREMNAWEEAAIPAIATDEAPRAPSAETPVEENRLAAKPASGPQRPGPAARPASSRREISKIEVRENRPITSPAIAAMRGLMPASGIGGSSRSEPEIAPASRPEPASAASQPEARPVQLPSEDSGRATIPFERPSLNDLQNKVQASKQTPARSEISRPGLEARREEAADAPLRPALRDAALRPSGSTPPPEEPGESDTVLDLKRAPVRSQEAAGENDTVLDLKRAPARSQEAPETQPVKRTDPSDVTVPTPRAIEPEAAKEARRDRDATPVVSHAAPAPADEAAAESEKTPETPASEANWFAAQAPTPDAYAEDEELLRRRRLPKWALPAGLAAAAVGVVWLIASSSGPKKTPEPGTGAIAVGSEPSGSSSGAADPRGIPTAPAQPAAGTVPPPSPTAVPVQPMGPESGSSPGTTAGTPAVATNPARPAPTVEPLPSTAPPAGAATAPRPEVTPLPVATPVVTAGAKPEVKPEAKPAPTVEPLATAAKPEARPEARPEVKPTVSAEAKPAVDPEAKPGPGGKGKAPKGKGADAAVAAAAPIKEKKPAKGDPAGALKSLDDPAPAPSGKGEVAALVSKGKQKLDDGDPDAAAASFERAMTLDGKNAEAVGGLGEASFEQGNFDAAVRHLLRASKLSKKTSYRELLAQAQFKLGRFKEAADTSRAILKDHPGSAKAKQILESAEKKLGG